MKRWIPVIALVIVAALSPAPIKDTRPLVRQPELSDAERAKQQQGVRMGTMGSVPTDTEMQPAPSITGDSDAAKTIQQAGKSSSSSDASARGAAAVIEASNELEKKGKPNYGRVFAGALIVFAAFGLFQVFRMWANKALPDAPTTYK